MMFRSVTWRAAVDLLTTAAILITCAHILGFRRATIETWPPVPRAPVSIDGANARGDVRAPVVIIEWSDYECPFCERAEREILPKINLDYVLAGKVQLVFRHLPLEKIHPRAMAAAQAAECAATQGRFWEMHAALFADQRRLDDASFIERADRIGVDLATFRTCLSGPRDPRISDDVTAAQALKLTGTPVFLIGVRRADGKVDVTAVLSGVKPVQQFIDVLGRLLLTGDRVPH